MSKETAEERFARRNALFSFRRAQRLLGAAGWVATGSSVAAVVTYIILTELAHWNGWAAAGIGVAIWIAGHALADMWPRGIPPQFDAGEIGRLEGEGWTFPRLHPFLCTEKDPHVHLVTPEGGKILLVWRGESTELPPLRPGECRRIVPSGGRAPYWEGEPPPGLDASRGDER